MASILLLNDDCLCNILSLLSDCGSFYSFVVACRRFANFGKNTRYLRKEILQAKAEFYLKKVLIDYRECSYETSQKLQCLLKDAVNGAKLKCLVTEEKIMKVWEKNGPVASKLFLWTRSRTESRDDGEPRATCSTKYTKLKLHLPSTKQCMTVSTSYFRDCNGIYDDEMTVEISCGDLNVSTDKLPSSHPDDYSYYDPQDLNKGLQPLQPARELLNKELGVKLPDRFFFWFCFFCPFRSNLSEEDKVFFDDVAKNVMPSREQLENSVATFRKETKKEKQFARAAYENFIKTETKISESLKPFLETLDVLLERAETRMVQKLEEDASRTREILGEYELKKLPSQLMLSVLRRTNLDWSNFSPGAIADKRVSSSAEFKLTKGQVLRLEGTVEGDGAGLTEWLGVNVKFSLPDNTKVELGAGYEVPHYYKTRYLKIDQLQPVTKLVQECINHDFKDQDEIPEITDAFTALYFLAVLEFSWPAGSFLDLEGQSLLAAKEEESSDETDISDSD